jgi:dUTP diphosphatase
LQEINVLVKKIHPDAKTPAYSHSGPAGDLAADLFSKEQVELLPGQVLSIGTGLAIEVPMGFGAIVEDRSGLALRGLTTLAGVIDTGYRGEIRVVLANLGQEPHRICIGDRIAQIRIVQRFEAKFVEVDEIGPSARQHSGFGSTGA